MPLDVFCPHCGECYFETNDHDGYVEPPEDPRGLLFRDYQTPRNISYYVRKYDPEASASAAMIRLKKQFIGLVDDIQHDQDLKGFAVDPCPGCFQPLSDEDFKFITRPQDETCKYCGRVFETPTAKATHEKQWCQENPNRTRQ